jgi:hypothetical protein
LRWSFSRREVDESTVEISIKGAGRNPIKDILEMIANLVW